MLELFLTTLLPAITPALIDGTRGLFNRVTGGATAAPGNFGEFLELRKLDIEHLKALASLDTAGGNISGWVANLRASSRYIAALAVIAWAATLTAVAPEGGEAMVDSAQEWARAGFFFLFGDRTYQHLKRGG